MVTLSKIYTRTGDKGTTRLVDNSEVRKTDLRVEAYGHVDEANSAIGVALALGGLPERVVEMLGLIQNELFDLGSDIANPLDPAPKWEPLRIEQPSIDRLEAYCDELQDELPVLRSFILPGGSALAAHLHVCRTVARRAERHTVALAGEEEVNAFAVKYLNRASDWFFVAARIANDDGRADVLWVPGANR